MFYSIVLKLYFIYQVTDPSPSHGEKSRGGAVYVDSDGGLSPDDGQSRYGRPPPPFLLSKCSNRGRGGGLSVSQKNKGQLS